MDPSQNKVFVRYFEGDYPDLSKRLEDHFARVRDAWERGGWSGALVLGGGYGRGEGGVMISEGQRGFSNDLDYFLFHEQPGRPDLLEWCRRIEKEESILLGIDVEIKSLPFQDVEQPEESMMFSDLVAGHVAVAGDAGFLEGLKARLDFSKIGAAEATRLLWNRGSGLYFSRCRISRKEEMGFVIRNHAKMKLALGDSWLCLQGLYTPQCRERGKRLAQAVLPAHLEWLKSWHAEGVDFKFRPFREGISWEKLTNESQLLVEAWTDLYLTSEAARLGCTLPDFASYLNQPRLMPEKSLVHNLSLAMRDRLLRGAYLRPLGDYPRAALMRALACLLGSTTGGVAEAGRFLPPPAGKTDDPAVWESTYSRWWAYYA